MALKEVLSPTEIPFMHYGIINKYNYSSENIRNVPIKRWDPLSFNYGVNPKYAIYSYISGHYSYISPVRGDRPVELKPETENDQDPTIIGQLPGIGWENRAPLDPFEPQLAGKHYISSKQTFPAHTIVIADGTDSVDNPFIDRPKLYPHLQGNAVTIVNKFPAMVRVLDPEVIPKITQYLSEEDPNCKIAQGICTLTVPRRFYSRLQDIPVNELRDFFLSMQATIKICIHTAVEEKGILAIPISPFFNVGRLVGGSMRRIHSQLYLDLCQDGHGTRMETLLQAFDKMHKINQCHLDVTSHGNQKRLILENDHWSIFATGSPIRNYHLRFSPKTHIPQIEQVTPSQFFSLAKLLKVIFMALDDLGVNPNRNIIWNTKPYGYDTEFHIFGDILPYEFVGGAEMAEDMRVVRMSPITAATQLREIITTKYSHLL
jgi:UDPglucose--hexose-1-phosphate uridylyltransferase